jgi:hypothetical protein
MTTRDEIVASLAVCVERSNWYFDQHRWMLAEQWDLRAQEWQAKLDDIDAQLPLEVVP